MATKPSESSRSKHGLNDVIGIGLLALALLLFVSQWSFDRYDLSFFRHPHNEPLHNWAYQIGAHLAWFTFLLLGVSAYLLPLFCVVFGVANFLNRLHFLRERPIWSLLWTSVLFIAISGLAYLVDMANITILSARKVWVAGSGI